MPERILVVDDEPNMLRLLKTILMDKTGYEVTTTNNPLEVSKLLQEDHYHVVITDLKMPLVDGMDLIEIIKKIDRNLPIIITIRRALEWRRMQEELQALKNQRAVSTEQ